MRNNPKFWILDFRFWNVKTLLAAVLALIMPAVLQAYKISGAEIKDAQGKAVKIVAVNAPDLLTLDEKQSSAVLQNMAQNGVKQARILASFCGDKPYSFQTAPGVYNAEMFARLDRTVAEAGKAGIRLVIALADGSGLYGGKEVYQAWSGGSNPDVFFKDRISINTFKNFVKEIVARQNTVTKAVYSADDTIFAWDLCNAAGSENDPDGSVMYAWAAEMSSYIKTKDKMHLVTVNLAKQNTDPLKINNYDVALLANIDYVTVTGAVAAVMVEGYNANAGRPVAAILPADTAGVDHEATGFFNAGGSILYVDNDEISYKTKSAAFADALKTASAVKPVKKLEVEDTVATLAYDGAGINVTAPQKSSVTICYGLSEPLKNEVAGAPGIIKIEGLKAGTKYLYRVKASLDGKGSVSAVKSFTTKNVVRLKSVPFAMSNNFIKAKDGAFWDGNKKYRYVGANNYYIRHKVAGNKELVDEIFREAAAVGIKVIRIGSNGEAESMDAIDKKDINRFFRVGPDYFNEAAYKEFDYVMDSAARHGIRVIIHFTDNWEYYGGCKVYVKWAGFLNKNLFWTDAKVKEYFKQTVDKFVTRKNTVNGKLYKNDPAIFAYDLLNEPRNEDDLTAKTLTAWIDEMSTYIKSKDPNHMVTTGMEGFFLKADGTHWSGSDFTLCHTPKNIDFCTFHIYPASVYNNFSPSTTAWMLNNFIKVAHETVKKPVVMEEYGIPNNNPDFPKAKWISDMTEGFIKSGGDGLNYWFFIDPTYNYGDGNEVNYKQTEYMNSFIKAANEANKGGY